MHKVLLAAATLFAGTVFLAACGGEAEQPAAETAADAIAGVEVTNARLVLPPVGGNPAAVYFDVANKGERSVTFRGASVAGAARAEMHETVMQGDQMVMGEGHPFTLQPGDSAVFAPGGRHVMVFDLGDELSAGGTAEVTLIAAGNKPHVFTADVVAAGADR